MKKIVPIVVFIVVVLVGAYFYFGRGDTSVNESEGSLVGEIFEGNLEMAIGKGVPLKCEWSQDEKNFGTYFVKEKKVYTEVTTEGEPMSMIMKDNCMWSWDSTSEGTKLCFKEIDYGQLTDFGSDGAVEEVSEGEEMDMSDMNFKCAPVSILDAKFEAPDGVNFIDPLEGFDLEGF